jgi:hypothetical protein
MNKAESNRMSRIPVFEKPEGIQYSVTMKQRKKINYSTGLRAGMLQKMFEAL